MSVLWIWNFNPCFLGFQRRVLGYCMWYVGGFQSLFSWISTKGIRSIVEGYWGVSILVFLDFNLRREGTELVITEKFQSLFSWILTSDALCALWRHRDISILVFLDFNTHTCFLCVRHYFIISILVFLDFNTYLSFQQLSEDIISILVFLDFNFPSFLHQDFCLLYFNPCFLGF